MDSKEALKISIAILTIAGLTYVCIKKSQKKKKSKNLAVYVV